MSTMLFARRRAAVILLALIAMTALSTALTSAHCFGGRFPYTRGTWLYLGYTQSGAYATPVHNAARSWHNTPTRAVVFTEAYANSEIDFFTQYRSESWWGLAVNNPCSGSGCTYRWSTLYLNSRTLGAESDFIRQKVAAHEFGLGLGLAHTTDSWYSSIMKQGYLNYNTPQQHDINDFNALYPY